MIMEEKDQMELPGLENPVAPQAPEETKLEFTVDEILKIIVGEIKTIHRAIHNLSVEHSKTLKELQRLKNRVEPIGSGIVLAK